VEKEAKIVVKEKERGEVACSQLIKENYRPQNTSTSLSR